MEEDNHLNEGRSKLIIRRGRVRKSVGHFGALAEATPFVRRVVGSTPALAAT